MKFFKLVLVIVAISFAVLPTSTALAIADPDSISIDEIKAYQNVVETNDILFVGLYDINYGSIPTETTDAAFLFRLIDTGTATELGAGAPYGYVNSGYDAGAFALYFSASDVDLLGVTWQDPNYEFRLQGNPSLFASPPVVINNSIVWNSVLTTQKDLVTQVSAIAFALELNWAPYTTPDIDLIFNSAGGNVFTQDGENYFGNVIPNARSVVPELFTGRASVPVTNDRSFSNSYRDQLLQFWDNSSIGASLDGVASVFNTPRTLITTLALIAFNVVVIMAMIRANPQSGQIAPLTTAIILPVGALIGLTDLAFAALIAMFATFGTVFVLYLRRG